MVHDVVETRKLVIKDDEGVVRAELGCDDDGATLFILRDVFGNSRVRISVLGNGDTRVMLGHAAGELGVWLGVSHDGVTSMGVASEDDRKKTALILAPDGHPELVLSERDSEGPAQVFVFPGPEERLRMSGRVRNGIDGNK